jgi:hypothetical protein
MPKKTEQGDRYIKSVTDLIKQSVSMRDLYRAVHGMDPTRTELQRFSNRFNPARSNPGVDLIGLCVEHVPELQSITLGEAFGVKQVLPSSGARPADDKAPASNT